MKNAVNAVSHSEGALIRLKMDITGSFSYGIHKYRVHKGDDRSLFCGVNQLFHTILFPFFLNDVYCSVISMRDFIYYFFNTDGISSTVVFVYGIINPGL